MYIDEWKPLQENANLVQLELTDGYYADLQGRLVIKRDDMKMLGLNKRTEIAISISGKEWNINSKEVSPPVFLDAVITSISIKKGLNLWSNVASGAEYIEYLDISIKFKEFDATGNLLVVKDHARGVEFMVGDTLFLKVQRVITRK